MIKDAYEDAKRIAADNTARNPSCSETLRPSGTLSLHCFELIHIPRLVTLVPHNSLQANAHPCTRWNRQTREWQDTTWADLLVGDYVKLADDETAGADMLILCSQKAERPEAGVEEEAALPHSMHCTLM